jgi:hypothetical protein
MHYDKAFESDHCAIFCGIDKNILANKEEPQVPRQQLNGTNSTNKEEEAYI